MAEGMLHILHLYLLLALLMSTHVVGGVESTIYSLPKDKLTVKLSRQRIVKVTKNLVNYYLYFGESETSQFGFDNETCLRARNDTHAALASAVVTCVNPNFTPRILTKNQVTWKPKGTLSPQAFNSNVTCVHYYYFHIIIIICNSRFIIIDK